MRKILIIIYSTIVLFCLLNINVEAAEEEVVAEKIWSVALNSNILNTKDNLNKVYVTNDNNEKVAVDIKVNEIYNNIIEIYSIDPYLYGTYKLIIESGFQSHDNVLLKEEVIKEFKVTKNIGNEFLSSGLWQTEYFYEGPLLKEPQLLFIEATYYEDGFAKVIVKDEKPATFRGNYIINSGNMIMSLNGVQLNFNGKIRAYSSTKYKIINANGKLAYFYKNN